MFATMLKASLPRLIYHYYHFVPWFRGRSKHFPRHQRSISDRQLAGLRSLNAIWISVPVLCQLAAAFREI